MYFDSVQALLVMDGHGIYVWPAYILTVVVMVGLLVVPVRRRRRILQELSGRLKRSELQSPSLEEDN